MKLAVRLAQIVVVLSLLVVVIGFLLPQQQRVERSIVINAPATQVFPWVNSAKAFHRWSPWAESEPDLMVSWFGPEQGKGAGMKWESMRSGPGSWTITHVVDGKRVDVALEFGGQNKATSWFELAPVVGGTQVTWGFETDAGMNPIHRWFGLMLDDWVGQDYERGLHRLQETVEGRVDIPV